MLTSSSLADTDIIHLDVVGKSIVVLDSYEAAVELLEKRSKMYSDRWAPSHYEVEYSLTRIPDRPFR